MWALYDSKTGEVLPIVRQDTVEKYYKNLQGEVLTIREVMHIQDVLISQPPNAHHKTKFCLAKIWRKK